MIVIQWKIWGGLDESGNDKWIYGKDYWDEEICEWLYGREYMDTLSVRVGSILERTVGDTVEKGEVLWRDGGECGLLILKGYDSGTVRKLIIDDTWINCGYVELEKLTVEELKTRLQAKRSSRLVQATFENVRRQRKVGTVKVKKEKVDVVTEVVEV